MNLIGLGLSPEWLDVQVFNYVLMVVDKVIPADTRELKSQPDNQILEIAEADVCVGALLYAS